MSAREELERSEVELNRLLHDKMGRRSSVVKVRMCVCKVRECIGSAVGGALKEKEGVLK